MAPALIQHRRLCDVGNRRASAGPASSIFWVATIIACPYFSVRRRRRRLRIPCSYLCRPHPLSTHLFPPPRPFVFTHKTLPSQKDDARKDGMTRNRPYSAPCARKNTTVSRMKGDEIKHQIQHGYRAMTGVLVIPEKMFLFCSEKPKGSMCLLL